MRKTVLITGCSSGFGRALCREFSENGYFVVATARNPASLKETPADMKVRLDVSDDNSIYEAMDIILKHTQKIDVLINNAGYSFRSAVEEIDVDKLKEMYDVNVLGTIRMMRTIIPVMRKQGGGRIYNIGSISGRITGLANGAYCSTKYSIEAITEAARYETREMGIEICVIEPGAMNTGFFKRLADNSDEKMKDQESEYFRVYERDLSFRSRQSKSDVYDCARKLVRIDKSKRLKVRYTVGVSAIYTLLAKLPDGAKEWAITRFNQKAG